MELICLSCTKIKAEPKGAIPATSYFLPPKLLIIFGALRLSKAKVMARWAIALLGAPPSASIEPTNLLY